MTNVFTPATVDQLQSATEGTIAANILTGNGTLIGFMANSFYALMAIIFPMAYSIMLGNRLIAERVDKGSMAGFLSTPTTRSQITVTSALYLVLSLIAVSYTHLDVYKRQHHQSVPRFFLEITLWRYAGCHSPDKLAQTV